MTDTETEQTQQPLQTVRKRGRPFGTKKKRLLR